MMSKIIVTIIESVLTEKGKAKIQNKIDSLSQEEGNDIDWESLGLNKNTEDDHVMLYEEDSEIVELEAGIMTDEISYYYQTPRKDTTTLQLLGGDIIEVKEDVKYFHKNL